MVADDQDESHSIFPSPLSSFSSSVCPRYRSYFTALCLLHDCLSYRARPHPPTHSRTHTYTRRERREASRARAVRAKQPVAAARCAVSSSAVREAAANHGVLNAFW